MYNLIYYVQVLHPRQDLSEHKIAIRIIWSQLQGHLHIILSRVQVNMEPCLSIITHILISLMARMVECILVTARLLQQLYMVSTAPCPSIITQLPKLMASTELHPNHSIHRHFLSRAVSHMRQCLPSAASKVLLSTVTRLNSHSSKWSFQGWIRECMYKTA